MKFDDHLAQYLYETKALHLEGIGTFNLDKSVALPNAGDKEIFSPIEGLTFTYNIKDVTPEDLITFLVKKLGKIEPLVRSDLESYLSSIKQFINIGNPYTIEGIGTLYKNNQGIYEFTPGTFHIIKDEPAPRKEKADVSQRIHETKPAYKQTAKKSSGAGTFFIVLLVLAVLGGIGWFGYSYFLQNNRLTEETTEAPAAVNEPVADTALSRRPAPVPGDSLNYKMIFETTGNKDRVFVRTARLKSYKINIGVDTIAQQDTVKYRLFIPVRLKVADTTRYKDSLSRFSDRPVIIEPVNP